MSYYVGIDIGAVSATAALLADSDTTSTVEVNNFNLHRSFEDGRKLYINNYTRTRGKPIAAATEILENIIQAVGEANLAGVVLTGSGAKATASKLNAKNINEFRAIAAGLSALELNVATVFEIGGEASKYLHLERNESGQYGIVDYSTNGDCAAGTGSFIDQQAGRLRYKIEEIGEICNAADRSAQVAGRCSVFAKSDMIHAQQKGYNPSEVLRGLCDAVARNFKSAVVRSHPVIAPVAFIGGVTENSAVVRAMLEAFSLTEDQLMIPEAQSHIPAIGAANIAMQEHQAIDMTKMSSLRESSDSEKGTFPTCDPLKLDNVMLLRDAAIPFEMPESNRVDAYLGIDIGSVSTNLVLIDPQGRVIDEIYVRTQGRPIQVVSDGLREIEKRWADKIIIKGVGTTGSGRELIGSLIGADTINDEITAHKTGATFVGQTILGGRVPDTIFEIGGQDSKYISLQDGVVVDFTMNEACAAGTGSFLEERAEELDVSIKGEFAQLAMSSQSPIRLGERCTVFMERDVNSYMQRGAEKPDLLAGLSYSVVYNYINRVVRGRKIGETIFFQGGTAYNDATAAAFSMVTGKEIIVPPHNGVMGAVGAALLARDKMTLSKHAPVANTVSHYAKLLSTENLETPSQFRGYDINQVDYQLREFTCKACSNHCQIQEFTVEGDKTYWGDKCSEKFRKQVKAARTPVLDDLIAFRMEKLLDDSHLPKLADDALTMGIPLTMFSWKQLPFWQALVAHLGFKPILSDQTNKQIINAGTAAVVAEPCFPIIAAHGHVANLLEKNPDYMMIPNIISLETKWLDTEAHLCPWHQTLPFIIRRAPSLAHAADKVLAPLVPFREGVKAVKKQMVKYLLNHPIAKQSKLSKSIINNAIDAAYKAQNNFRAALQEKGKAALEKVNQHASPCVILVGRPYNIYDAGMNLSVAQKLRDYYGVDCIPLDFLDTSSEDVRDINDSMYWDLGRRILAAAKIVGRHENLHIIYITNFKCGPDSFIKHFIKTASGKPFLSLQFDGHSNDAGMMTRCEAYLDSKGILRPWRSEDIVNSTDKNQVQSDSSAASV